MSNSEPSMRRHEVDPRFFGDRFGYNRAILLETPRRWLVVAGHEARTDDGSIAAVGDMPAQIGLTSQRLTETLGRTGLHPGRRGADPESSPPT